MRNLPVDQLRRLLGVAEDATSEEVAKAYKRASLRCHSDKPGGNDELFRQITVARDIFTNPSALALYEARLKDEVASHKVSLDSNTYRAQFSSYRQWFEHSLRLVQTVRSYRRSFFSLRASDTAANTLLRKLEDKSARLADVEHFMLGEGGWEETSTKTLFFELLHGPVSPSHDKKIKAIRWLASLSGKSLADNPNPEYSMDPDFLTHELKTRNSRQLAIEIELGYLNRYLPAEYSKDPLVIKLLQEKAFIEKIIDQVCAQIYMCDTVVARWEEQGGPLSSDLAMAELQLIEISYQYALFEMGASEEENTDALMLRRSATLGVQQTLLAERTRALGGERAVTTGGASRAAEAERAVPATSTTTGAGGTSARASADEATDRSLRSTRQSRFFTGAASAAQTTSATAETQIEDGKNAKVFLR